MRNIKVILLAILLLKSGGRLIAQSQKKSSKLIPLQEAIEVIENDSDYIFNYDPALLKGYTSSGVIDNSEIGTVLDQIFYHSPYRYEINGKTILIYYPDPQLYKICGTLKDALSKDPLIGANVSILNSTSGIQSDLNGYFDFDFTGDKDDIVEISYLGYQPIQFSLQSIKADDCPVWNLTVNQDIFGSEIVISDYLLDGISVGDNYSGFSLDFDQLSKNHSTVEHDILKTAQLLPGITSIDDSATNLQIRGSNPGQNLVLWEGVPLYNAGHIFGMISAINPFSIEEVSIYKGAYNPKYDNRVGGILDISLSDNPSNRFFGSAGTTMTELHSNLSIPLVKDKVTLAVSGRQSLNGVYNSPTLQSYLNKVFQFSIIEEQSQQSEPIRTEQSLDYSDWNAKLIYRPSDQLLLSGGFYRNAQDFNYTFWLDNDNFSSIDEIRLNTQIISFGTEYHIMENWLSELSLYQSSYSNDYSKQEIENAIILNRNDQLNSIEEQSLTFSNGINIDSKWIINLGYEYNNKEVVLNLGEEIDFDPEFIPFDLENARFHNLFQSFSYNRKNLQVEAGNRSTYYQEAKKWFHSPRLNLKYALGNHLTLKADVGVYHQFVSQLTNVGAYQIKVDNPLWMLNSTGVSLSQQANKFAAGLVYQRGKWLFDLEGYYNDTQGISNVGPQLGVITERNGFSQGSSKVIGMDMLLKKRWGFGLNTWLSYSLGFAKYNFPDFQVSSLVAPNDIRHNVSVVSSYTFKDFQFSLNTHFHSGLPFSQAQLLANEEDPDAEPPFEYFLDYEAFNAQRLDYYLRFDLNASYRFDFKPVKDSQMEIACSVLNLHNRTNTVATEFWLDYDEASMEYSLASLQKTLLDRTALLLVRFYW